MGSPLSSLDSCGTIVCVFFLVGPTSNDSLLLLTCSLTKAFLFCFRDKRHGMEFKRVESRMLRIGLGVILLNC